MDVASHRSQRLRALPAVPGVMVAAPLGAPGAGRWTSGRILAWRAGPGVATGTPT
jgi:hypothetical protein